MTKRNSENMTHSNTLSHQNIVSLPCQFALLMLDHDMEQDTSDHISPTLFGKVDDMEDKSQNDSDVFLDLYDGKLVGD